VATRRIEGLLFDIDGTLTDSNDLHAMNYYVGLFLFDRVDQIPGRIDELNAYFNE